MKFYKLLLGLVLLSIIACKDDKTTKAASKKVETIQHYICDNKCENSGGAIAENCPTCNTPYTHNVKFHANDLLKSGPINVKSNATQPDAKITTDQQNRTPEPTQNAAGVYHYTCKNGCNGGAGTTIDCISCGEKLEHNKAYHN